MWPFKKKEEYIPSQDWDEVGKNATDRIRKEFALSDEKPEYKSQYTCHECRHIAAKPAAKTVPVIDRTKLGLEILGLQIKIESWSRTGVSIPENERVFCKLCVPLYDRIILDDTNHPIKYTRTISCNEEGKLYGLRDIAYHEPGTIGGNNAP